MKICIVGGTGHISTAIVNQLLKQEHNVFCFNRGSTIFFQNCTTILLQHPLKKQHLHLGAT